MSDAAPVQRRGARVLLLDADERLLLFRGCDPAAREAGSWWFTPGGGVDDGERALQAAVREVREETGLSLPPEAVRPLGHTAVARFSLAGRDYEQTNVFFLARVAALEVDTAGFSALERQFVLEHRWWAPAALRATADLVYPADLLALLARAAGGAWC